MNLAKIVTDAYFDKSCDSLEDAVILECVAFLEAKNEGAVPDAIIALFKDEAKKRGITHIVYRVLVKYYDADTPVVYGQPHMHLAIAEHEAKKLNDNPDFDGSAWVHAA